MAKRVYFSYALQGASGLVPNKWTKLTKEVDAIGEYIKAKIKAEKRRASRESAERARREEDRRREDIFDRMSRRRD